MVYLTRKAEFSASHYYHNPALTPEENARIFGKCNNPNGHGHNYTLEVTVKGAVDPKSGFVVDLKQLKDVMSREVLDALDHRFLNKEVPEFFSRIPTTEISPSRSGSASRQSSMRRSYTACASTKRRICLLIFTEKHEGPPDPAIHVFGIARLEWRGIVGGRKPRHLWQVQ